MVSSGGMAEVDVDVGVGAREGDERGRGGAQQFQRQLRPPFHLQRRQLHSQCWPQGAVSLVGSLAVCREGERCGADETSAKVGGESGDEGTKGGAGDGEGDCVGEVEGVDVGCAVERVDARGEDFGGVRAEVALAECWRYLGTGKVGRFLSEDGIL